MYQPTLFPRGELISLEDIFAAYFECRRHKRRTLNALHFELNLEENLIALWRELNNGTYRIGRSIAFIVSRPVLREVFAADFRDRIVHHLVIRKLLPLFEAHFSPASYSCRKERGTLYGIRDISQKMYAVSQGYTRDCYVLRLDISGFFMHIDLRILYHKLASFLRHTYQGDDKFLLLKLLHQIVFNRPQDTCRIRCPKSKWLPLPPSKSLFGVRRGCGLPIGNLTSQIFANFYLNELDAWISSVPGIAYGRYVDDLILIHPDRRFLCAFRQKVACYLKHFLNLTLHPKKVSLQHYAKGFSFVGAYIKPYRLYAGRRLKHFFFQRMQKIAGAANVPEKIRLTHVRSVVNSYFGFLKHYSSLRLRRKGYLILTETLRRRLLIDARYLKVRVRSPLFVESSPFYIL